MNLTFKRFLDEGIIDDFPDEDISDHTNRPMVKAAPPTNRPPTRIRANKQDKFVDYYASISELGRLLGDKPITITNIAKLYAHEYLAPRDNLILDIPLADVYKYREYDRTREQDPHYWDGLFSDIKNNGIEDYSVVNLDRLPNGDVGVLLGEGNHRLAMGLSLGYKTMPIYFSVRK